MIFRSRGGVIIIFCVTSFVVAEGEITGRCGSSVVHAGKCLFLPCSSSVFKSLPLLHRHGLAGRSSIRDIVCPFLRQVALLQN